MSERKKKIGCNKVKKEKKQGCELVTKRNGTSTTSAVMSFIFSLKLKDWTTVGNRKHHSALCGRKDVCRQMHDSYPQGTCCSFFWQTKELINSIYLVIKVFNFNLLLSLSGEVRSMDVFKLSNGIYNEKKKQKKTAYCP